MAVSEKYFQDTNRSAEKYNSILLERDELAMNLGGGIPRNSLIVLIGEDGSGKSIVAQRLSYGFLEHETEVCYISTELNTISFIEQMESLEYDIKYRILNGKLLFIPMFPVMGKTKLKKNFLRKLLATKEIFEKEVIIFDTLSFLLVSDEISQSECYDFIGALNRLTTLGKTIIFCIDPNHINDTFLSLLKNVSDIYVKLMIKSFAGNIVRAMNVIRFKRPEGPFQTTIPFRIEPGKGLAIEIATLD